MMMMMALNDDACVQVRTYLRESNKAIQMQIMLQGESDRQVINSVFKTDKPLRLELQRKRLHQALENVFDKFCVSNLQSLQLLAVDSCWCRRRRNGAIGVGAQSTLGRRHFCPKNMYEKLTN